MTQPFQFANGQVAHSAEDLLELCKQFPADGTNYLVREDIEKWLTYIGKEDIAQCAATARQAAVEDRQKLEEFLNKCHALASPEPSIPEPPPVPEESPEQPVSEQKQSPVIEQQENLTPVVTANSTATSVNNPPPATRKSDSPDASERKPSFFRAIARLIVNVLYRHRN